MPQVVTDLKRSQLELSSGQRFEIFLVMFPLTTASEFDMEHRNKDKPIENKKVCYQHECIGCEIKKCQDYIYNLIKN